MANEHTDSIDVINDVAAVDSGQKDPKDMELEQLTFLLLAERMKALQNQSNDELKSLKARQDEVIQLHKLLKLINSNTSDTTELTFEEGSELQTLLNEAKEKYGIGDLDGTTDANGNVTYTRDQRERLIDNIRMSIDDRNTNNEMQIQTVTRLVNERYEFYQMARAILKPIHDDKMNKARAIAGR